MSRRGGRAAQELPRVVMNGIAQGLPTVEDAPAIAEAGGRLILAPNVSDIGPLVELAPVIRELNLEVGMVRDLRPLMELTELEALHVDAQYSRYPVDLTVLPKLWKFSGTFKTMESVLDVPTLRWFETLRMPWERVTEFVAPLESLALYGARTVTDVPLLRDRSALKHLTLSGPRMLRLSNLTAYADTLELLAQSEIGVLTHAELLLEMPKLDLLTFADCPDVEPLDALEGLDVETIRVGGRNVFDDEFRRRVAASGQWTFPPKKGRRPIRKDV